MTFINYVPVNKYNHHIPSPIVFKTQTHKPVHKPSSTVIAISSLLPERGDFNTIVSIAKDIPAKYHSAIYTSLKNDLKKQIPILTYGRLLFVVPQSIKLTVSVHKLKIDIQLALATMNCNPTGRKILASAREKGMPVLVEITDDGVSCFEPPEQPTTHKNQKTFNRNYDSIKWSPYIRGGHIFYNSDGSESKQPSWAPLLHELGHLEYCAKMRKAYLKKTSSQDKNLTFGYSEKFILNISTEEQRNLVNEQKALKEAGLTPRQFYKTPYQEINVSSPLEVPK